MLEFREVEDDEKALVRAGKDFDKAPKHDKDNNDRDEVEFKVLRLRACENCQYRIR